MLDEYKHCNSVAYRTEKRLNDSDGESASVKASKGRNG